MSILNSIKNNIAKSGSSKGKVLYFKEGSRIRVRFLHEIEDFTEVMLHDSYDTGMQLTLCPEHVGKHCPYCEDESIKNKTGYVGSAYDHESKEVKLFLGYAHQWSALPALVENFEARGTAKDRDYTIVQNGKGTGKTYAVISGDKAPFKNAKAKPYSQTEVIKLLSKAFPDNEADDEEDDYEEEKPKKKAPKKEEPKKKRKPEPEPEEDEEDDWDEEESDDEIDYTEMSALELFKLCKERGIKATPKKKPPYYIDLLEEYDEEQSGKDDGDDWDDEEEDEDGDDW